MGSSQSSPAVTSNERAPNQEPFHQKKISMRGRKSKMTQDNNTQTTVVNTEEAQLSSTTFEETDTSEDYIVEEDTEEETDEEIEAGLEERRQILKDAQLLKQYATFHYHPERKVTTDDATAFGRNYFTRVSAPEQVSVEEMEEQNRIMEEVKALKQYAQFHLMPEKPVVTEDAYACGRNYFSRYSAEEQEAEEDMDERDAILAEVAELKKYAQFHLCPEKSVTTTDATACGRNYFTRYSADEQVLDTEERDQILQEAMELKKYAQFHLCPEKPVVCNDATATGRNYFSRFSADEQVEDVDEREQILAEAAELKKYAEYHLQPEKPVICTDATACGRNYYSRFSAEEQEDEDDMDERDQILAEAAELKKYAGYHLCPEKPVVCTDPTATARNYFSRFSAEEQEDEDDMDERDQILAEAAELKKYAGYHLCPEKPVVCTDPTACGRNYFSRFSAEEQELEEDMDERDQILAEAAELKKYAGYHLCPEKPVVCTDATACGRNYFSRFSAEEQEDEDDMDERDQILAEAMELKKYAGYHLCPEKPVVCNDATACGRNYFSRFSAEEQEDDMDERDQILAEAAELKKYAGYHLCPEKPVVCNDATATARNYFSRFSAEEQELEEDMDERDQILAEAMELKKYADYHLCPEKSVVSTDPTAKGRNYFSRFSAEEQISMEEMEERDEILKEAALLKQFANFHLHPEKPVVTADAAACGRNYFSRISAPAYLDHTEQRERETVMAEGAALKQFANYHMHPEKGVEVTDATASARNFFSRPTAPTNDMVSSEGHAIQDAYDFFEMDEEMGADISAGIRASLVRGAPESFGASAADMVIPLKSGDGKSVDGDEEGKLSRSPSSVMLLFDGLADGEGPAPPEMENNAY